ncbi:MAG: ABC transporter substrate-binding protein [Nitrospirae bacterium]|nr:ABC transporter substrate-binding protein [Nitrospirota bacterium]
MGLKIKAHKAIVVVLFAMLLAAPGQPAFAKSIGVIMTADTQYYRDISKVLGDALGKDVEIIVQKPQPDPMSWTNAARKVVGAGASVIVTLGAPATLTTMKETSDVPIIFGGVYDPDSMNMTGKNATGMSSSVPIDKVIKQLSEISKFAKLGIIFSKSEKDTIIQIRDIKKNEAAVGFESVMFSVTDQVNKDEIKGVNALLLTTCGVGMMNIKNVVDIARRDKIPTAALMSGGENTGIILTFSADPKEQGEGIAEIVKKVLGGAKPADLAVKQPKQIQVILNLKEAKAIGLSIPASVQGAASKVIE